MKTIDVLPKPKSPEFLGGKIYFHVLLSPSIIDRMKMTAHVRGYKPGPFLEELLDNVLPKKIRSKVIKQRSAKITMIRSKESR